MTVISIISVMAVVFSIRRVIITQSPDKWKRHAEATAAKPTMGHCAVAELPIISDLYSKFGLVKYAVRNRRAWGADGTYLGLRPSHCPTQEISNTSHPRLIYYILRSKSH